MKRPLFALLALFLLWATLAEAGDNDVKLCRGGSNHGKTCTTDANCPADSGGTAGRCLKLGHPAMCSMKRYCNISTSVECEDAFDCPLWPFTDPADFCVYGPPWDPNYNPLVKLDCTSDANCKQCSGPGPSKGRPCLDNSYCYGGGTCTTPGVCLLGAQQSQWDGHTLAVSGNLHDLTADAILAQRTIEDAPGYVNAQVLYAPNAVFFDNTTGDVYVHEAVRVTKRTAPLSANQAANVVIGQPDFSHEEDDGMPGDVSTGFGLTTRRIFNWTYWGGVFASHTETAPGLYIMDRYVLRLFPLASANYEPNTKVWGNAGNLDQTIGGSYSFTDNTRGPAVMQRCNAAAGLRTGYPCTVATEGTDCGVAGTCKTTACVADSENNRVPCWRDIGAAATGVAPDYCLGQSSCSGTVGNYEGSITAKGLNHPNGVAFNPADGTLWVTDKDNNRVVMYPTQAVTGEAATLVVGAANLTTGGSGFGLTGFISPIGIAINPDPGNPYLAITSGFQNRVLTYSSIPVTNGATATAVLGQPDPTTYTSGRSSDGVKCDRLSSPYGVSWDSTSGALWVADFYNGRAFRFTTPFTTGSGQDATTALLQGQPNCGVALQLVNDSHMTFSLSGAEETNAGRLVVSDTGGNRVLVWNSSLTARQGEPAATSFLGQNSGTGQLPNQGSTATAATLASPTGVTWTAGTTNAPVGLYVADSGNNRVLFYNGSFWTTGQSAAKSFGQAGSFLTGTANKSGFSTEANGALNLNQPRGIDTDNFGNLWVADQSNGRVLMYCMDPGSIPSASGSVCTVGNSGDDTADLVLGKPNMVTVGCTCSPVSGVCTAATGATMCQPMGVAVDFSNPLDGKVFVADDAESLQSQSGRILVFAPGANWASGISANYALGSRPMAGSELTSYGFWGRGTCESTAGASQQRECNYNEPGRVAAGGTGGKTCVGGTNNFASCTVDANCPGGGTCGCPSGGFCLYRRQVGNPWAIQYDATRKALYVARQGGVMQFIGPTFSTNMVAKQTGLKGSAHEFNQGGGFGSFVENSFGGNPVNTTMGLDSEGNLYMPAGPLYGGGMLIALDAGPEVPTDTPTATWTPSSTATPQPTNTAGGAPTQTPTVTQTPTKTPTPTITPTGTPTNTFGPATGTPTGTPTITPTFTPVQTNTVAPTFTPQPGTNTPGPIFTPTVHVTTCLDGSGVLTTNMDLCKPPKGWLDWHTPLNANYDRIDSWFPGGILSFMYGGTGGLVTQVGAGTVLIQSNPADPNAQQWWISMQPNIFAIEYGSQSLRFQETAIGPQSDGSTAFVAPDVAAARYIKTGTRSAQPAPADCDLDTKAGRMVLDVTNHILYVCGGQARGWDKISLTD